jgi:hypothetical protein
MLTIEPTGAILGATVRGIDLARPLRKRNSAVSCWRWDSTACCAFRISTLM